MKPAFYMVVVLLASAGHSFPVHHRRNRGQVHTLARAAILALCAAPCQGLILPLQGLLKSVNGFARSCEAPSYVP